MKVSEFIKFDEKDECANSFYKGFNVWFCIRHSVFNRLLYEQLGLKQNDFSFAKVFFQKNLKQKIKYLAFSFFKAIPMREKNVIFFSTNVVNMKNGVSYDNRLYDYFYQQIEPNAILVEDSYNFEYRRPRNINVYYSDAIKIWGKIFKFFIIKNTEDIKALNLIVDKIRMLFSVYNLTEEYWNSIKHFVYDSYLSFVFEKRYYTRIFKKIRPKIVFREDASYGCYQSLAYACNELGIVFSEFQHGYVGEIHIAYNYGKTFFSSERLKRLLPAYYLTFGDFWKEQIQHPATKISVGFPYLQDKCKNRFGKKNILIVSDGDSPGQNKLLVDYVKEFAKKQKLSIILKLHPCEALKLNDWYSDLMESSEVIIRIYDSVYDCLAQSKYVIGISSTVIYETLCFGLNPFVYEVNKNYNSEFVKIFDTFKTKEDLLQLMNGTRTLKKIDYTQFFSDKWGTAFLDFIKGIM